MIHNFLGICPDVPRKSLSVVPDVPDLLERISIDPHVCFGKPYIRGHRIWVSLVLDLLAAELSIQEVLEEYPQLTREDVLACVAYGAEMSRERFVDVPLERPA